MFAFLKKLFGLDKETMKQAGVQIEQVPYKIEEPEPEVVPKAEAVVEVTKPKKRYYNKKPKSQQKATDTPAVKKPAEAGQKRRGRKPKS